MNSPDLPNPDECSFPKTDSAGSGPWGLPGPVPSTIMVALDLEEAPTLVEISPRLEAFEGEAVKLIGEPEEQPPFARWSLAFNFREHPLPIVLWLEPAKHDPSDLPPCAENARWMLGAQTVLDPGDPLATWSHLIRVLWTVAEGKTAVLDVESEQWFESEEVTARLLGDGATQEEGMLFRVHAVSTEEQLETADSVWLRTVGLHRCGLPELEMLEVPGSRVHVALELLKALGSLCIVRGVPDPGQPFEAGIGIDLSLQEWSGQAELLSPGSIGTRAHRISLGRSEGEENQLLSGRAVVCGAEPRGRLGELFTWPVESIERLERGEAAIERTHAWTAARSLEAQSRWPLLLEGIRDGLLARACVGLDSPTGGREHVWIEILHADDKVLLGTLLSSSTSLELEPGEQVESSVDEVIDWALVRGASR